MAGQPGPAVVRHRALEEKRAVEVEEPMARALAEIFVVNVIFGPAGVLLWLALDAALALGVVLGVVMIMRRGGGGSRRLRRTLAGAIALFAIPLGVLSAVPTPGETEPRRIELYDHQSNRVGYVLVDERAGRLDLYDRLSNRTGYGRVAPDGRVDLYGLDGRRDLGSILRRSESTNAGRPTPAARSR